LYLFYRLARIAFARDSTDKADNVYRAALYRFHMAGLEREGETPLEYAEGTIDPQLGTHFADFMRMYLRLKYANGAVHESDRQMIKQLADEVGPAIRKQNGSLQSLFGYFNIAKASRFFFERESFNVQGR
ncbi:MAG: DUF4129 domain-containing protein, partial [Flammeovirgaceae bacterium]